MDKEIVLRTYLNRGIAEMAKGLLDQAGIVNMLSDDDIGGFQPGMIIGEPIKLIVNEVDLARAKKVINRSGEI